MFSGTGPPFRIYRGSRLLSNRPQRCAKLSRLVQELVAIVQHADRDGVGEKDIMDKSKVVIFSYFADTVDWIYGHLQQIVEQDSRLKPYQGRIAAVPTPT